MSKKKNDASVLTAAEQLEELNRKEKEYQEKQSKKRNLLLKQVEVEKLQAEYDELDKKIAELQEKGSTLSLEEQKELIDKELMPLLEKQEINLAEMGDIKGKIAEMSTKKRKTKTKSQDNGNDGPDGTDGTDGTKSGNSKDSMTNKVFAMLAYVSKFSEDIKTDSDRAIRSSLIDQIMIQYPEFIANGDQEIIDRIKADPSAIRDYGYDRQSLDNLSVSDEIKGFDVTLLSDEEKDEVKENIKSAIRASYNARLAKTKRTIDVLKNDEETHKIANIETTKDVLQESLDFQRVDLFTTLGIDITNVLEANDLVKANVNEDGDLEASYVDKEDLDIDYGETLTKLSRDLNKEVEKTRLDEGESILTAREVSAILVGKAADNIEEISSKEIDDKSKALKIHLLVAQTGLDVVAEPETQAEFNDSVLRIQERIDYLKNSLDEDGKEKSHFKAKKDLRRATKIEKIIEKQLDGGLETYKDLVQSANETEQKLLYNIELFTKLMKLQEKQEVIDNVNEETFESEDSLREFNESIKGQFEQDKILPADEESLEGMDYEEVGNEPSLYHKSAFSELDSLKKSSTKGVKFFAIKSEPEITDELYVGVIEEKITSLQDIMKAEKAEAVEYIADVDNQFENGLGNEASADGPEAGDEPDLN